VQHVLKAATFAAALTLVACGGGGGSSISPSTGGTTSTPTPAPQSSSPASMPQTASIAGSSAFISSSNQHTLYFFGGDTSGVSNCNASNGCSNVWPPYNAPAGTVAPSGSTFSIITRSDGTLQWAYNGSPMYEYSGDSAAGQDNGQGITSFGATWSTARPTTSSPSPTSSPGGNNGYTRSSVW
jgi:predicted lipoprotein with Yx(FWY)xxD motif